MPHSGPDLAHIYKRADFRLALSQWETSLQSNAVSHWLGANLEQPCTCHIPIPEWHPSQHHTPSSVHPASDRGECDGSEQCRKCSKMTILHECMVCIVNSERGCWRCHAHLQKDRDLLNSFPPSATYMRQWIRSALVQIMACHLLGAKPLSVPMQGYC